MSAALNVGMLGDYPTGTQPRRTALVQPDRSEIEKEVLTAAADALERWFNETPEAGAAWTWTAGAQAVLDAAEGRRQDLLVDYADLQAGPKPA